VHLPATLFAAQTHECKPLHPYPIPFDHLVEHGQRANPQLALAIKWPIDYMPVTGFTVTGQIGHLIQATLEMSVTSQRNQCPVTQKNPEPEGFNLEDRKLKDLELKELELKNPEDLFCGTDIDLTLRFYCQMGHHTILCNQRKPLAAQAHTMTSGIHLETQFFGEFTVAIGQHQ